MGCGFSFNFEGFEDIMNALVCDIIGFGDFSEGLSFIEAFNDVEVTGGV